MITHLYISNFTLIDTLDIDFRKGFSVITGETGAGKSIILGAINLLLGQRADLKQIKMGAQKCTIEAHFDISKYDMQQIFEQEDVDYDAQECIMRRELTASGKSRAFINDSPVSLVAMRNIGASLVDIHSQHQNLLINDANFQLNVVDIIAENSALQKQYRDAFSKYIKAKQKVEQLKENISKSKEEEEYLRFQQQKLSEVELAPGMQEELEHEQSILNHAEDIKSALLQADNIISGDNGETLNIVEGLKMSVRSLESIRDIHAEANALATRIEECYNEVKDIAHELALMEENVEFDPQRMEEITQKLDAIYSLQQRYHVQTVDELIALREEINEKLKNIDNSDEVLEELIALQHKTFEEAKLFAEKLSQTRRDAAMKVEEHMLSLLVPLGIPKVQFKVDIQNSELSKTGQDNIQFLFSANTSTQLSPVSQVASGGEIARVMLSLKAMISGTVKLPTIIFDEIDTGVSGKIAEKMALIMSDMGKANRQVVSITHLPQIAAQGTTHYRVEKEETSEGTTSRMRMLSNEERITEIAQMLSGSDITEAAINNAKELLKLQ